MIAIISFMYLAYLLFITSLIFLNVLPIKIIISSSIQLIGSQLRKDKEDILIIRRTVLPILCRTYTYTRCSQAAISGSTISRSPLSIPLTIELAADCALISGQNCSNSISWIKSVTPSLASRNDGITVQTCMFR